MKKLIILITLISGFASCKKGDEFRGNSFPGFTGSGNEATWVVYRHNVIDATYLTAVLPAQTPPTTLIQLNADYKASYAKEVSPFSVRLIKGGGLAMVVSSGSNQYSWVLQSGLKWEPLDNGIVVSRQTGSGFQAIATGYSDQDKLLLKFTRAAFGDNSADKNKAVLDVYYSFFN